MSARDVVAQVHDAVTIRRVYGEPYEKDGVTVIPAAIVAGGGGGGGGLDPEKGEGAGGGFGLYSEPIGAYAIKDGVVRWTPAFNVNALVIVALLVIRSIAKHWARR
jgi:uncharacterized spore protein YtfJ